MSRIGFFNPPSIGHLYPAAALGRRLAERGHDVTFFNYSTTKAVIRKAGLNFYPFTIRPGFYPPPKAGAHTGLSTTSEGLRFGARTILTEGRDALVAAKIDALVIDQLDLAAGTVAEFLDLPYITLSILPPAFLDSGVPPIGFHWRYRTGMMARIRNRIGDWLFSRYLAPTLALINRQRYVWALPELRRINDIFSKRAIITQLPESFDFPMKPKPPHLFYTGPFVDSQARRMTQFPWERLGKKRLVYASMGTIRNDSLEAFRAIAEACSTLDAQLVISMGGNTDDIGPLPGNPVVVQYAPQLELLQRANLTITHAGINTALESLAAGVPLIAIPISDDQPGVAARIDRIGAGMVLPFSKLTAARLREAISLVLEAPKFRAAACRMKDEIRKVDGLRIAEILRKRHWASRESLRN